MNRTTELADFLDIALRGRIESIAELAEVTGGSVEATAQILERLEELGFVSLADGVITYRRPDSTMVDVTHRILTSLAHDLDESIVKTQGILRTLPKLLQAWEHGKTEVHGLPIDVMHGPFAAGDMYELQASRAKPHASYTCMPDTGPLYKVLRENGPSSWWDENAVPGHDIRLLVSIADANTELGRNQIVHEINAGSQVRMHPNLPSFFWILDHKRIGIPFEWGDAWPSSIMAIESLALAGVMTGIYNRLWEEAVPVAGHNYSWENPWDPILRLMNSGLTMESASSALGLTARTGRRRVADAMRHFGVSSQFSLGAAWSASLTSRHAPSVL